MPKATPRRRDPIPRTAGGRFAKGNSANPAGRPRGIVDRRARLRDAIQAAAPDLIARLIKQAKAGDTSAASLLISRAVAPLRAVDEPLAVPLALPDALGDKARTVLAAVAERRITPDQGASLLASVGVLARVLEAGELESRLAELEARLQEWERKTGASGSKD
jgi:hypothetical protein